jgi:TetR/AcrR family transcriptional regulator, transcriptional repressor for nem operon
MNKRTTVRNKRTELVLAATSLLHEQGYHRTSLADVATRASVPLGNVYYYFKTKDDLAEAVIANHEIELRNLFASWETAHASPRAQLRCYIRAPLEGADSIIRFGCPHGSLCQELEKLGSTAPLAKAASRLLALYLDWTTERFQLLGFGRRESVALAQDLVASVQGTMLVASTMHSADVLESQLHRVESWLSERLTQAAPRATA